MNRPYLGAAKEEKERDGAVGMSCIFQLDVPLTSGIQLSLSFCLETDILKTKNDIFEQ